MGKLLKRIRGAVGLGLIWGAAWFGVGMVLLVIGLAFGEVPEVPFPILFGLLGFLAGIAFSGILAILDGRRRFDEISTGRVAGWGAVGGVLLAVGLTLVTGLGGEVFALAPIFALGGAGCAAGSLTLAKRAEDRYLLDDADRVEELG